MSFPLVHVSVALGALAGLSPALARDFTAGTLTIVQPWTRATPGGARISAGYLAIRNAGDTAERLLAVTSDLAAKASPHRMAMRNGVMEMRPIMDGVVIPAHGEAVFRPGADHLMFEGLKQPLRAGETLPATLTFETAGKVPVDFTVEAVGAQGPVSPDGTAMSKTMKMD